MPSIPVNNGTSSSISQVATNQVTRDSGTTEQIQLIHLVDSAANPLFTTDGNLKTIVVSQTPLGTKSEAITGTAASLVVGATATVATFTVVASGSVLYGLVGSGDTDGVYVLNLNGTLKLRLTSNVIVPNPSYAYPMALSLSVSDVLQVQVTNTGLSTGDYTASILGAF